MLSIAKAHAYGNDFLFVPHEQVEGLDTAGLARETCARHSGLGADGLILYTLAQDETARMTLINADGSPSEVSGNGVRCLATLMLFRRAQRPGLQPLTTIDVSTDAGWKRLALVSVTGGRMTFRAAMGRPSEVREETLDVAGETVRVTTLRMGNPQCVALVPELPDTVRFDRLGPALATHPRFPAGTNVEFAHVASAERIEILIWERGVGPTQASGTGACAAAVAAIAHEGAARDVVVVSPGGQQRVEWRDEGVYLTGWAEVLFDGHWVAHSHARG
ncbi:MAG: diaminopimelate epimerase [Acidobacteriota bacterium]